MYQCCFKCKTGLIHPIYIAVIYVYLDPSMGVRTLFVCELFDVNEYHPAPSQNNHQKRQTNHLFMLMNILTVHLTTKPCFFFTFVWESNVICKNI